MEFILFLLTKKVVLSKLEIVFISGILVLLGWSSYEHGKIDESLKWSDYIAKAD